MDDRPALKRQIIDYTSEAILKAGVDNLTVDEISAAAGISKRTFYEIFASKSVLVEECFTGITEDYKNKVTIQANDSLKEPLQGLISLARIHIEFLYSADKIIYMEINRKYKYKCGIHKILEEVRLSWLTSFQTILHTGEAFIADFISIDNIAETYLKYLEFLRETESSIHKAYTSAYIFLRGMLNEKDWIMLDQNIHMPISE